MACDRASASASAGCSSGLVPSRVLPFYPGDYAPVAHSSLDLDVLETRFAKHRGQLTAGVLLTRNRNEHVDVESGNRERARAVIIEEHLVDDDSSPAVEMIEAFLREELAFVGWPVVKDH